MDPVMVRLSSPCGVRADHDFDDSENLLLLVALGCYFMLQRTSVWLRALGSSLPAGP